jgi:hypothetical protein
VAHVLLALALLAFAGCDRSPNVALIQQMDAQRIAADMRVQLHRSVEAVQRAIMADTDDASNDSAREAHEATDALEADRSAIDALLADIGSAQEKQLAQDFGAAFTKLRELDRTLLALAVENTNVKAQRLSFGPAREAADALRDHLDRAAESAPAPKAGHAQLLAARTELAVSGILVRHGPHIAEADDGVMTQLEQQMADLESSARASLAELAQLLGSRSEPEVAAAREQLDRFTGIHQQIVTLSRENSDVRSLASALGEKRELTATCDAALIALQSELAKHGSQATR